MTNATHADTLRLAAQLKLSPHDLLEILAHTSALDNLTDHADHTTHGDTGSNLHPPLLHSHRAPAAVLTRTIPGISLSLTSTALCIAGRRRCANSAAFSSTDHRPTHLASPLASGRPP